jgi:hypothetical protein
MAVLTFDARVGQAQREVFRPAIEEAEDVIGHLLKPITVVSKTKSQMPDWNEAVPGVQPAWELWKGWNPRTGRREVWVWNELHTKEDAVATLQHGLVHALHEIHTPPEAKAEMCELMHPRPEAWLQGGAWSKYPYECATVYGSAVLFGIAKPVYKNLLDRRIWTADWPRLRELHLR